MGSPTSAPPAAGATSNAGVGSAARIRHRRVMANGLRFHVAECGAGQRLALCLHGFPELWLSWRHQMPVLAELGYRVWAPDLRGYGGSDRPPRLHDYDIELLMSDIAALIDAADARETVLIGHDWGGIIAWYVAMRRLRPLQRLVIMNAPHPGAAAAALRSPKQLWRSWYAIFFQIPWLPERLLAAGGGKRIGRAIQRTACHPERFPDDVLAAYSEAASTPEALRAMLNYYRALARGKGAKRQRKLGTSRIDVPTLMLWGEEDVALTRATSLGAEQYVSDLTVRRLPGVSHWVQQDDPETVNAMLVAWLRDEPVPEAPD